MVAQEGRVATEAWEGAKCAECDYYGWPGLYGDEPGTADVCYLTFHWVKGKYDACNCFVRPEG